MKRVTLDARGLLCPLPVIRLQDRMKTLAPGTLVEVLSTDPGALIDIPAWCRMSGHHLVEVSGLDDEYRVVVEARTRC